MTAKEIAEALSEEDIINLLLHLGANKVSNINGILVTNTICHGGDSNKLYYYPSNKNFHCYTNCGHIGSVFDLVMEVLNIDFTEAYIYICSFFNIKNTSSEIRLDDKVDNSFISKFKKKEEIVYDLKHHDEKILKHFDDLYHISWINDNISIDTMKKFNIKFDILNNRIIIPHYDKENNLIGIRCRNLKEEDIKNKRKYMPVTINDKMFNYPTHANFYGLNIVKEAIRRYKKVILVESEKAVMQFYTYYGKESIAIACSGSSISFFQIKMLLDLGVENIILALDKDFLKIGDKEELDTRRKVKKAFIDKLIAYFNIEIVWDFDNLLEFKDAPSDKGVEIWERLYKKRLIF